MVNLSDQQKINRASENRRNNECDVIGYFLKFQSIKEGKKRDLHINDFQFKDTRDAFNHMNEGYFYDKDKISESYINMIECRGADTNIFKKINYLIGFS
tara:strand:- start:43 stop:339 length:297 start_codon:yes stop_codon:yes gene_type:complete